MYRRSRIIYRKRSLSLLLVLLLVFSLMPIQTAASGYNDIDGHWANSEITMWSGYEVLKGSNGLFRPDAPITRGEMAVILDRIMRYKHRSENTFYDLDENFYTDSILGANNSGIILGNGALVRPKDIITREEAAVIIGRALGIAESSADVAFADEADISSWARGYVSAMTEKKLINGWGGKFSPKTGITRAETVKIIDNAIKGLYKAAGEYTGDINGTVVVNTDDVKLKNMKITGNLIIAEGVGEGEVILDSVEVTGETFIRGGGTNSIKVTGKSHLPKVTISKRAGMGISFKVEGVGSNIGIVIAENGKVNISGDIGELVITSGMDVS